MLRLTPESLFFALVAVGLPLAVTIGLALGETSLAAPPATPAPAGFGGLGAAPERDEPAGFPKRTYGPRPAPTTTAPVAARPRVAEPSVVPSLSAPPGPKPSAWVPTLVPSESLPSATSSADPAAEPSVVDADRGYRNP